MLKNISGFHEFSPQQQILFRDVIVKIVAIFESYGFCPLDTSAVERVETLIAKGNDNEIYALHRLAEDSGPTGLALRFDLTVPLARYVAQHYSTLLFPYRRYQIAPVWRGERPQAGRYRQFYQCDIDIVGNQELSSICDAEILSVAYDVLTALDLGNFVIKVNCRKILSGLVKTLGIQINLEQVLRILDKASKISADEIKEQLEMLGVVKSVANSLVTITQMSLSNEEWFNYLLGIARHEDDISSGVTELQELLGQTANFGLPSTAIQVVPSLARGLNYYTGMISETVLLDNPRLGSICGGGRYADLASTFGGKKLPGVGLSIGLSRIFSKLEQTSTQTVALVFITVQEQEHIKKYVEIAQILRRSKIKTELFLENKPLSHQLKLASKKGFRFVVMANLQELESNKFILRDMIKKEQFLVTIEEAIALLAFR